MTRAYIVPASAHAAKALHKHSFKAFRGGYQCRTCPATKAACGAKTGTSNSRALGIKHGTCARITGHTGSHRFAS
jgi:hypothetical protein